MHRIDGVNPLATSRTQHGVPAAGVESTAPGSRHADGIDPRHDALLVSDRGRVVARAALAVQASPDVRHEKVAALKAAIAAGVYQADPEAIARRLVANGFEGS